jgi:hypothetical protein
MPNSRAEHVERFRFVQPGGRDGHDGLFSIPGLPVGGASNGVDAVLTGGFTGAQFDLRRPNGEHIQDLALTPVADNLPDEFGGTVTLPGEPFLAYVTGNDAGGNPFQRNLPNLIQPQSVSIVVPVRQDLHPGERTSYTFTVRNLGDDGTFELTATDDKGFIVSADTPQASIPAGGSADVTVVLQPPADAALGTSDALTVRVESVATPGFGNFASLTSVVVVPLPATTSTTTTSSSTTIASAPSPTTTTVPCTTPRCTIGAALRGPECGDEVVPAAIRRKLDQATGLIDRAGAKPRKKAARLLQQARSALKLAGRAAGKAAKGRKRKLTKECATAIQRATSTVSGGLHP